MKGVSIISSYLIIQLARQTSGSQRDSQPSNLSFIELVSQSGLFYDSCEIPQLFAEIHYFLTVSALLCCRVHINAEIVHQASREIPIGRVTI